MDIKVNQSQLSSVFNSLMKEYSSLESADKSYDYWVQEKGRYTDIDVVNFYKDVEMDWEDDEWILQYHEYEGDSASKDEVPLLLYGEWEFRNIISILGVEIFEKLLKDWFENTFNLKVKKVDRERG